MHNVGSFEKAKGEHCMTSFCLIVLCFVSAVLAGNFFWFLIHIKNRISLWLSRLGGGFLWAICEFLPLQSTTQGSAKELELLKRQLAQQVEDERADLIITWLWLGIACAGWGIFASVWLIYRWNFPQANPWLILFSFGLVINFIVALAFNKMDQKAILSINS